MVSFFPLAGHCLRSLEIIFWIFNFWIRSRVFLRSSSSLSSRKRVLQDVIRSNMTKKGQIWSNTDNRFAVLFLFIFGLPAVCLPGETSSGVLRAHPSHMINFSFIKYRNYVTVRQLWVLPILQASVFQEKRSSEVLLRTKQKNPGFLPISSESTLYY